MVMMTVKGIHIKQHPNKVLLVKPCAKESPIQGRRFGDGFSDSGLFHQYPKEHVNSNNQRACNCTTQRASNSTTNSYKFIQ